MEQQYSTLELVKYDETTKAPERDHDATAFELDASALAPQVSITPYVTKSLYLMLQVAFNTAPQVLYDSSLPEALGDIEESSKERAPSRDITTTTHKWVWVVVALFSAAAIAVGAVVGIWRHREHSTTARCESCKDPTSS